MGDCSVVTPGVCLTNNHKSLKMKIKLLLSFTLIASQLLNAQQPQKPNDQLVSKNVDGLKTISIGENDTTSKLPTGTKFVKGKIAIQSGYKAVYSSDKKIVAIQSAKGLGLEGSFSCTCTTPGTHCGISTDGGILVCEGGGCCGLIIVVKGLKALTMEDIETAPEKLKWKKMVLPVKSN